MNTTTSAASSKVSFNQHPKGLWLLFMTEFWERFSYYGMRAILVLFLIATVEDGGFGMTTAAATAIYGWYTSSVYLTAIPGGWLADRYLGQQGAVLLGGIFIAAGHFCLAFINMPLFYTGLVLIAIGTGLLKPNISTIVGQLYEKNDPRRDGGFSIFYMGINLGAFVSPLICGYLGQKVSWHWGFAMAGVGMVFGLIQFWIGRKQLGTAGLYPQAAKAVEQKAKVPLTLEEKKKIGAIFVLFIFSCLFWAGFEQAGSSLNLFAEKFTINSIFGWEFPSSWHQSTNSIFIIALAPIIAWLWIALGRREPSSPAKFVFGLLFVGLGFLVMAAAAVAMGSPDGKVSAMWLTTCYFLHTIGELCLSPVGLSTVTKLAPPRMVGLMMGVWFLSISFGNKLGGWIAGFFEQLPLDRLFGTVALTTLAATVVLILLVKPIKKLMGDIK